MIKHLKINFQSFDDISTMVDALASRVLKSLTDDIKALGTSSWAVSGGSTPKPLFEKLSNTDFDWPQVNIALVDERWVPASHARSNESFVKNTLLKDRAKPAHINGMFVSDSDYDTALSDIEHRYKKIHQPFTSVLLGMGNDGHTASLFPNADGLEHALNPDNNNICAALNAVKSDITGKETKRISLTFNAINHAQDCILMITGTEKFQTLADALEKNTHLPIARVINSMDRPLNVFWTP
jgi:6-phosphogluconolactonase